jgi:hypothetical protein
VLQLWPAPCPALLQASIKFCDKAMMIARMVAGIANKEACRTTWIK